MLAITPRRSLAGLAVAAGLLTAAGPAAAQGGGDDFTHAELRDRIECAVDKGWLRDRPAKAIARAYQAGNRRVVKAIRAADPQECTGGVMWDLHDQWTV
jgi:hypothetical protein